MSKSTMSPVTARVGLTDGPARCSSCWGGPDPGVSYVEFRLPHLLDELAGEGSEFIAEDIDDLIVCERCIRDAALRLGLRRAPRTDPEVLRAAEARNAMEARVREAQERQNELRERIERETPR